MTDDKKTIAFDNLILHCQVGSGVYGTALPGTDDRDEMGICLEPPHYVTGISAPFEQYEHHTAWERPGGRANRSQAGDTDVVIYSARKWARLAAAGNPTILLLLFIPDKDTMMITPSAEELIDNQSKFVSRQAANRFIGYLTSQMKAITGGPGAHTNRPELIDLYGFDTKYAMHALRLGLQGEEYLTTGHMTLPIPEPDRNYLVAIRRGEVPLEDVLHRINDQRYKLIELSESSTLPTYPDVSWINNWLHRSYTEHWKKI